MKIAYITSLFPFAPEEQFFEPEVRELCREFDVLVVPVRPPSKTSAYPGLPAASLSQRLFGLEVALSAAREFLRAPVPAMIALAEVVFGRNSIRARVVNLACFPKALAVARHIRRRRIEHVHAAWLTTPATVAYVVWRLTGVEFSITAHAHDVFANNIIEKKVRSARFTRVISRRNCDALRTQLSQQAAERCVVGHLGVELPDAVPNHENPRPRILCPARLCTWKGHRYLLDALRILSDRGHAFSCDFAGGGELHDEIGSSIVRLGLQSHVRMLGNVPHADFLAMLESGSYDIAVLASTERLGEREGIPVALMESMAAGLPVVATRTGSIAELVVPGAGILVNQRDPVALADALQRYLTDPSERRAAGARGRLSVRAEFEVTATTTRLIELVRGPRAQSPVLERVS